MEVVVADMIIVMVVILMDMDMVILINKFLNNNRSKMAKVRISNQINLMK
jgi:hypothetical protein